MTLRGQRAQEEVATCILRAWHHRILGKGQELLLREASLVEAKLPRASSSYRRWKKRMKQAPRSFPSSGIIFTRSKGFPHSLLQYGAEDIGVL